MTTTDIGCERLLRTTSGALLPAITGLALIALTACGGQDLTEPPALSDIDDLMWDTMDTEDSVTITMGSDDSDSTSTQIYGDIAGDAFAMGQPDRDMIRIFGEDERYISGDLLLSMPGKAPDVPAAELDAMAEDFADVWIDHKGEYDGLAEQYRLADLLDQIQDGWSDEEGDSPMARDEISDQGTYEVRDDVDVWVYPGSEDGKELVIEADHDAPRLRTITDGASAITLSDWGTTELPQRPEGPQVITEEEFDQRVAQHTGSEG